MNMKSNRKFTGPSFRHSRGMTILDVLLGIVIFVVGMLALASLQGNLTKSSADASARTMGANITEELIEHFNAFEKLRTTPGQVAYQDIVDTTLAVTRGGLDYTVAVTVEDWFFMPDGVTITKVTGDLPSGTDTTISDFKYIEMNVQWAATDFQLNDGTDATQSAGRLGSGDFTVSSIVPSIPQLGSAKIAAEDDGALGTPPIDYTPGTRPETVAISLTDSKFKESTTPMPDVKRADELVETWFDVITYNTIAQNNSIYLRREEFVVLTCECTLNGKPGDGSLTGFLPTIWNGESYQTGNDGEMVSKAYGVSANNQQSQYCDTCCRDHHDTTSPSGAEDIYDPARLDSGKPNWSEAGGIDGDHKHYARSNQGSLNEAGDNNDYVEACRMVRKDGFMRVAQDFRQEGLYSFPEGYLDTQGGVDEYSNYVTTAVSDFYANDRDELASPSGALVGPPAADLGWGIDFPADRIGSTGAENIVDTTTLPLLVADSQQMSSRGIYIDYLSSDVEKILDCLADMTSHADCASVVPTGVTSPLQVLPFYDIQTTLLAWWVSDPAGRPVSLTSEQVVDDNGHSRGLAVLEDASAIETVEVFTEIHRGNIGLTVTDPITLRDSSVAEAEAQHLLFIDIGGGGTGTPTGYTWSGSFVSGVNQVDASSAAITPTGNTFCSRSGTSISCVTPNGENGGLTVSGYVRRQGQNYVDYWICASGASGFTVVNSPAGINNSATVSWSAGTVETTLVLSIEASACP